MILMEAIEKNGGVLTVREICLQIANRKLFTKGDGTLPDTSYVLYGIKNYFDNFEVIVRLKKYCRV
jgi:hypothetical protein